MLTAAVNAYVHIVQNLALESGQTLKWSMTDFNIVVEARYDARKLGAYALFKGFSGWSMIA